MNIWCFNQMSKTGRKQWKRVIWNKLKWMSKSKRSCPKKRTERRKSLRSSKKLIKRKLKSEDKNSMTESDQNELSQRNKSRGKAIIITSALAPVCLAFIALKVEETHWREKLKNPLKQRREGRKSKRSLAILIKSKKSRKFMIAVALLISLNLLLTNIRLTKLTLIESLEPRIKTSLLQMKLTFKSLSEESILLIKKRCWDHQLPYFPDLNTWSNN